MVQCHTGASASVSVLSYAIYQDLQRQGQLESLQPSSIKLKSYTGAAITVLGSITFQAKYHGGNVVSVLALVVDGDGPNLLLRLIWVQYLERYYSCYRNLR